MRRGGGRRRKKKYVQVILLTKMKQDRYDPTAIIF
jgi:hypothetical protein